MNDHRLVIECLGRAFCVGATTANLKDVLREKCCYYSDLSGGWCTSANEIIKRMDHVCSSTAASNSYLTEIVSIYTILREGIHLESFDTYEGISPCEYAIHLYQGTFPTPIATVITMIDSDGKLGGIHLSRNTDLFNVEFYPDKEADEKRHNYNPFRLSGIHGFYGKTVSLKQYPLIELTEACSNYMRNLDWNQISKDARSNFVSCFDVSSSMRLFPHLQLDENYDLFCYITYEYHGLWGRVAAIKKSEDHKAIIKQERGLLHGPEFELPDGSVPPMEAIYNDGTPYGYFEAIIAQEFFSGLPYVCFERKNWDHCIATHPKNYKKHWRIFVNFPDFMPHLDFSDDGYVSITACWREFENGFGSSDGKDSIYLRSHSFHNNLKFYLFQESRKNSFGMHKSHIDDDKRYTDARHCCVFNTTSIEIAKQKRATYD